MAISKKVTAMDAAGALVASDLLYVITDVGGTPTSKKTSIENLLESEIAANVAFDGPVQATYLVPTVNVTPANSTDVPAGYPVNSMWSDGSYIYVVTGASALKRTAISTW